MAIKRYIGTIWRWLWLIILGTCIAAGTTYLASRRMTPIYEATTTLLVSEGQKPTGADYSALLASERLARTYTELLRRPSVLGEAYRRLGLEGEVRGSVTVELVRDTQLIRLHARDTNPYLAADIANTVAQVFHEQNDQRLTARMVGSRQALVREMQALQQEIDETQQALDDARRASPPNQEEIARLQDLLAQYRASSSSLLQSFGQIRVAEATVADSVTIVEMAMVPTSPVLPRVRFNTVMAAMLGALVTMGGALVLEYLDDTIKTPEDVELATRLGTFATISRFDATGGEPLMIARPDCAAAEGYRMLRTNIQFAMGGGLRAPRMLLLTSAQAGEGKTTTLVNLGISLAQSGKKVLLVDGDLRRSQLHMVFKLPNDVGVTTLLLRPDLQMVKVSQETGVEGLRVLTAGPAPANPAEVLEWRETAELLERLRSLADYVLIDSPPVLSIADASILAQRVDGVLLVTEMGRTRTDVLAHAAETLERVRAHVVGVVLNKSAVRRRDRYYAYHSYYGYHQSAKQRRGQKQAVPDMRTNR